MPIASEQGSRHHTTQRSPRIHQLSAAGHRLARTGQTKCLSQPSSSEFVRFATLIRGHSRQRSLFQSPRSIPSVPSEMRISTTTPEESAPVENQLSAPVVLLRKVLATWKLQVEEAVQLLGFDATDLRGVHDLLEGRAELKGRDLKDRIVCLYQIRKTLDSLLRDEHVENQWLRARHKGLYEDRPMDLLLEGSIEKMFLVRDYVEAVAGL